MANGPAVERGIRRRTFFAKNSKLLTETLDGRNQLLAAATQELERIRKLRAKDREGGVLLSPLSRLKCGESPLFSVWQHAITALSPNWQLWIGRLVGRSVGRAVKRYRMGLPNLLESVEAPLLRDAAPACHMLMVPSARGMLLA